MQKKMQTQGQAYTKMVTTVQVSYLGLSNVDNHEFRVLWGRATSFEQAAQGQERFRSPCS